MMFAGSQLDLVIGLDIHMEMVPMPAPTPMPFPMPFVGMIEFKPLDVLVQAGMAKVLSWAFDVPPSGPVLVNGFHAAKTGDLAKNGSTLPHFVVPPGTTWTPLPKPLKLTPKPPPPPPDSPAAPPGDAVLVTGSKTVYFEQSNATRLGSLAMSCSDPVRLPSSTLLAVPKGMPVLVGGPPAFDATAAASAFFLRNKWTAGALQELAFAIAPGGRMRNLLSWAACQLTGHPVDVATGRLLTRAEDARLVGPIPVRFERFYSSAWSERPSPLGYGWSHALDERVWEERGAIVYKMGDGREVEFSCMDLPGRRLEQDRELFYPIDRLWLRRTNDGLRIRSADGLVRVFATLPGDDATWFLVRIEDRERHWVALHYDGERQLQTVQTSEGRWLRFEHDRGGLLRRVSMQVPDGDGYYDKATFTYSDDGDLLRATDSQRASREYRYDNHLLVQETDRDGVTFWFEYDGRDAESSCVRTWGDDGQGTDRLYFREITYDKKNLVTLVENSLGHVTTYKMNVLNAVVEMIDPHGARTRYEFDEHLWKTAEVDPLGHATRFEHDARGNETKRVLPNGGTFLFTHDHLDRLVAMTDPRGGEWAWIYGDASNWHAPEHRLLYRRTPTGTTSFRYEGSSTFVRVNDRETRIDFGEQGEITKVTYPNGAFDERWYDRQGRLRKLRDSAGRIRRIHRDWEGRVIETLEPGSLWRAYRHSNEGDLLAYRDALRQVTFGYRGHHKLASREEGGTKVEYRYTSEDDLVVVLNEADEMYSFTRDACGRIVEELGFDGRKHTFMRDIAGRVVTVLKPSRAAQSFEYAPLGLLARTTYADGSVESFTYDALGALESATNASGTVRLDRDVAGRVVRESFRDEWVASAYEKGSRTEVTSSHGLVTRIARDAMNNVAGVASFERAPDGDCERRWHVTFARDDRGNEVGRSMPGGVTMQWTRDEQGLPRSTTLFRDAEPIATCRYAWEGAAQLRQLVRSETDDTRFTHDARGRLVAAQRGDDETQWRAPGNTANLFNTPNQSDRRYGRGGVLLEADGTQFAYDADGNLTRKTDPDGDSWSYDWNADGTLASVTRPDGHVASYRYDALKRRVQKTSPTGSTCWLWDGHVPVHETTKAPNGSATITWIFEPNTFSPLAKFGSDGRCFSIVTDYQGTPEQMFDEAGRLAWKAQLDILGNVQCSLGTADAQPWRWQGQYDDREANLYNNRMRYYDPSTGSYISQDPSRLSGGLDVYAYVGDPLSWSDPLGLAGECTALQTYYPPNDGFAEPPTEMVLQRGTIIDRFGRPYGRFVSPEGVPMPMRALPFDADLSQYRIYEVVEPIQVQGGRIAPAFGQLGGGIQYILPKPAAQLVDDGALRIIRQP